MDSENMLPIFFVNAYTQPIQIKVNGRASYLNSGPLSEFLNLQISKGKKKFVFDFRDCLGMDSTFLGLLAGLAMKLKQNGSIALVNVKDRNLELVENLGLDKIIKVNPKDYEKWIAHKKEAILQSMQEPNKPVEAKTILEAHENLIKVDPINNKSKLQDVVSYLKQHIQEKETATNE